MLTALAIDNAKPRESPYKIADGNGLHLLVNPNGSKLWRLRYRFGGKQLMLSLGSFPEVSLASARTRRDDARKLIADGKDPSLQRKLDKAAATTAASNTFRLVAEEYLRGLEERGCASHTLSKNRWLLTGLAAPLAERPIGDIKPAELLAILKRVEKSGRKSKLTLAQVQAIRLQLGKKTFVELAREYGVSPGAISHIKHGRSWTWQGKLAA